MRAYLGCALLEGFYNAEKSVTVVLTRHFNFLYNDDCFVDGWTIITILDGW